MRVRGHQLHGLPRTQVCQLNYTTPSSALRVFRLSRGHVCGAQHLGTSSLVARLSSRKCTRMSHKLQNQPMVSWTRRTIVDILIAHAHWGRSGVQTSLPLFTCSQLTAHSLKPTPPRVLASTLIPILSSWG
ncbi:hypothetical protein J1614_001229 [Plenodomus biglobosus]|nr:hypothetical protein J1614_001229 [Plenodomus biglobosus]